jgi:hypothetical protein
MMAARGVRGEGGGVRSERECARALMCERNNKSDREWKINVGDEKVNARV